jgi:hypothetical protein
MTSNNGELLNDNKQIILVSSGILVILALAGLWLSADGGNGLFVLAGIFGILMISLIIKYPKLWLYSIAISSFSFFRASSEGVSTADVLYGGYFIASTFIWIFWKMVVQRERIVTNIADWSILFFFFFLIINSFWSFSDDVQLFDWFREYSLFSTVLLYFPIKYYIREKNDIVTLLVCFGISIAICSVDQLRMYKENALTQVVFAYQLGISVRVNQTLFSAGILYSVILSLIDMKAWKRALVFLFFMLSTSALLVSFSRSFWLLIIASMIVLFFYINKKQRIMLLVGLLFVSIIGTIVFFNVFKEKSKMMTTIIEKRILSSTQGTKDISVQLRLMEYEQVFRGIAASPWFGNGLGKKIEFYDPNMHWTFRAFNIHNSYFFIVYRVGIPLALFFFFPVIYRIFWGERLARRIDDKFHKALLLGATATIVLITVASFASAQFFNRDGTVVLAVSYAMIDMIRNKYENKLIS